MYLLMIYMKLQKNQLLIPCHIKAQFQPLIKIIMSVFIPVESVHLILNMCFHLLLELSPAK